MQQGQQMRFTDNDLKRIKNMFEGEEGIENLKVLRKVFLPEIDPDAPIGQIIDLWLTTTVDSADPETTTRNLIARNSMIQHTEAQLVQLMTLAGQATPDEEKKGKKAKADSTE